MGIVQKQAQTYSFQNYLTLEKTSQIRHEYERGSVRAMAGGTKRHNRLVNNCTFGLDSQIQEKKCDVFSENVKLELLPQEFYVYPDVVLTCDPQDLKDDKESLIQFPSLIIEVLSEGTALYDQNQKKLAYLRLLSLQYYVFVAQHTVLVEVYERNQQAWLYQNYQNLTATIHFPSLKLSLLLAEVYKGIHFE